ncbi:MAG TPA: hypothetical protein IAC41_12145 [Candidatus Merdenecus merdavium]|nr:hypothetical protein [Candidatus Merdenecus merdavium]
MLGKLLKYDMKSTARLLIPIYLFVLLTALLTRFVTTVNFFSDHAPVVINFIIASFVIALIASFFITIIYLAYYFYRALFTDEGYLAFTLPVTTTEHIFSKLINFMVWNLINILTIILSVVIVSFHHEIIDFYNQYKEPLFTQFKIYTGTSVGTFIVLCVIAMFFAMIMSNMMIFAAIAIGHSMGRRKLLNSFLMYIVLNLASNMITTVIVTIFGLSNTTESLVSSNMNDFIHLSFWTNNITSILLSIVLFFVTKYFMTKRLNLD